MCQLPQVFLQLCDLGRVTHSPARASHVFARACRQKPDDQDATTGLVKIVTARLETMPLQVSAICRNPAVLAHRYVVSGRRCAPVGLSGRSRRRDGRGDRSTHSVRWHPEQVSCTLTLTSRPMARAPRSCAERVGRSTLVRVAQPADGNSARHRVV